jgi:hypothetical protein
MSSDLRERWADQQKLNWRETNKLYFANFQPPSQKTTGKGLEVNVKRSYKEQLTEPGHILPS